MRKADLDMLKSSAGLYRKVRVGEYIEQYS